jgi:hypothetical protein
MTDLTPIPPPKLSIVYSATAELTVELAKMLALVAPISMTTEQQELWLRAAADSLDDIRGAEVNAISAEVRRSVTRPSQIVPEIARLVDEKRKRSNRASTASSPFAAEMKIHAEAQERRAKAHGNRDRMNEAFEWERQARIEAGLHVPPREPALSRDELDNMLAHIRKMGLSGGFLEYRGGKIVEA